MRTALLLALAFSLLTACGPAPRQHVPSSAGADVYVIDPGAAIVINPGVQAGYGITANVGGSYRLVWTGDAAASGGYREFSGTVWTQGTFDSVTPGCSDGSCPLESDDVLSAPQVVEGGTMVTFDTFTTTGLDGFDFVSATEPVYFDLLMDGSRLDSFVFFASQGQGSSPVTMPFGLTTQ